MKRILFVCETVTMAHLMRTSELIKGLDKSQFEVHLAAGSIPADLKKSLGKMCKLWPLSTSVSSFVFLNHLAKGSLPYDLITIRNQVNEDLALMQAIQPHIVVGDFRLSLSVSARVQKVKYVNITNSTWHPQSGLEIQVPDIPVVRFFGAKIAKNIFKLFQPLVFAKFARPFLKIAKENRIEIPQDLLSIYVDGDAVFYADSLSLVPIPCPDKQHVVGGPILSSIQGTQANTPTMNNHNPNVVISLGSSGNTSLLPKIVDFLSDLQINIFVATGSAEIQLPAKANIYSAPFLPLKELFKHANLFIGNGGSAAGYLSLSEGVPFLAIPSNLDQFNFTAAAEKSGAAKHLRPEKISKESLKFLVQAMLKDDSLHVSARHISKKISQENSNEAFQTLLT